MVTEQNYLSPAARRVVQPGMTPCQQAQALNKQQLSTDAVKSLAHGLPEPKSVQWATASAERVTNPEHTTDFQAVQAAKAWCQSPGPQTQQLAAQAAQKAGFQTPGAWAAHAAASVGTGGGLTAHAVTGAVLLAASQAGRPISPSGISIPQAQAPAAPEFAQPAGPGFPKAGPHLSVPGLKTPAVPTAPAPPQVPPGPDGLALTPAERAAMAKNTDPYLKLGCDLGSGHAPVSGG
jgi:hypothetical protein